MIDARESTIPAVCLDDVWVRLGGSWVLEAVNLDIAPREFVGIIGPNGAGKSVLLRTILGLIEPARGRVRVFGQSPHNVTGAVAYVPQFAAFDRGFPIRVVDVVLLGRLGQNRLARPYRREDRTQAMEALAEVQLADKATRQIGRLSGGELQRVLIARALAVRAEIILLDEPTASLDPPAAHALYELLLAISQRMTVVLVSHDVGVMSEHVHTVVCLNRRILHRDVPGIPADVLRQTYGYDVTEVSHQHGPAPDRR